MAQVRRNQEVTRAIRSLARQIGLATKEANQLAAKRLARGDYAGALPLWEQAAGEGYIEAFIELAKYYEHRMKDIPAGLYWTSTASELVSTPGYPIIDRELWEKKLKHRLERLVKKSGEEQV